MADDRRVLAALLAGISAGGGLFVRAEPAPGEPDAFQVSRSGVLAFTIGDHAPTADTARALVRHAEERCAGLRGPRGRELPSTAVSVIWVRPGADEARSRDDRLYLAVNELGLAKLPTDALSARTADSLVEQLRPRLRHYRLQTARKQAKDDPQQELLDGDAVVGDVVEEARERPFDSWLTFLHPSQRKLVTRHYAGPARISGPAGTGKTVVALHRMRHLARRSPGPLLFTTFVRTLPEVHARAFRALAPELADRVEFTNLHAWALRLLRERGHDIALDSGAVTTAFSLAWAACRADLVPLEPDSGYWHDELRQVIGGRGLSTLEEYLRVPRRGRRLRLTERQKEAVWALRDRYRDELARRGAVDFDDVIARAEAEVARQAPAAYAAVVVDEVQDLSLAGLRLLHRVAVDGPNRLLLVGDGQQQVYPGGWRLSEAGIPVQGRGEVLRVNYRNRTEILDFARAMGAVDAVDDLDGGAGVTLREVEAAHSPGGSVRTWAGTAAELPAALVAAIADTPAAQRTAVIAFDHATRNRCAAALVAAGIAVTPLERYSGEPDDTVKVGTVLRAKGVDFQNVFVVAADAPDDDDPEAGRLAERRHLVAATRARDHLWWGVVRT
ncbi:UvrD-helicase domain-containing protein [Actinokineospora sp. G85]|uniref:UvrD-helicase domain-containing protein n=1 Tax=Actinokineospora sp. G85 TaxID=3406626 RepID=UPI003C74F88C